MNLSGRCGSRMKIVTIKSPKCLRGLLKAIFGMKD
ncbi:MAG: stage V sporulation protein SpoVM [Clostridia bacterium]|nr:stage V sporulation protein SpoVM [Clostridia bacterium]